MLKIQAYIAYVAYIHTAYIAVLNVHVLNRRPKEYAVKRLNRQTCRKQTGLIKAVHELCRYEV